MSKKLYVGNLPTSTCKDTLSQMFSVYGQVKTIDLPHHSITGGFMRFACITMVSELEAQSAIRELNGAVYGDNLMKVERWRTTERHRFFFR